MDLETVIYTLAAVIIFARLWTVFGRRDQNDRKQPNPFATPPSSPERNNNDTATTLANDDHPVVFRPLRLAPDSLAGGLEKIKDATKSFDEKQFLQGARSAFALILDDFSKGDLSNTTKILAPNVLASFQRAIAERREAGHMLENKLIRIREAETTAARIDGTTAKITVRFVSEQQNTLRDKTNQIINSEEGKVEEITDLWTFARDTTSSNPNWLLIETRS